MYIKIKRDNYKTKLREDESYWGKSHKVNKCRNNNIWYDDNIYPHGSCRNWNSDKCKYKNKRDNIHTFKKLVEKKIIFVPPPKDGVTKIQSMDEQVKIDRVRVGDGYVIIWGHLLKTIIYDTVKKDIIPKLENNDGKDKDDKKGNYKKRNDKKGNDDKKDKHDDKRDKDECFVIDGVVRHATCSIPIKYFAEIEEITKDDEVKIAASKIDNSSTNIYEKEQICTYMNIGITKYIKGIIIEDLIELKIKKVWY